MVSSLHLKVETLELHAADPDIARRLGQYTGIERRRGQLKSVVPVQKANKELVCFFLTADQFRRFTCLIDLYQREVLQAVKSRLLLAIGICSSLDVACSRVTLSSALPMELIREIGSAGPESGEHESFLRVSTQLNYQITRHIFFPTHKVLDANFSLTLCSDKQVISVLRSWRLSFGYLSGQPINKMSKLKKRFYNEDVK
ncbi:unnamed protein product [Echinostoma caproni]|uniref:Ribosomal protein L5 n=1 Tax=Echinostoma caproni TaxID=27848 RepID=A0A183BG22_9TREM|nr:unnamed protein product [Echinostoma caproni]